MDALEEKRAFDLGIANFCSENGAPEFAVPLSKFAEHSGAFSLDPGAFVAGFDRFVKRAFPEENDQKRVLRKILPWILVPASLYGVAKWGEMWGRHAYANGNDRGPFSGPLMSVLESLAGHKLTRIGRRSSAALMSDWRNRPLTAEQHESLTRTGAL